MEMYQTQVLTLGLDLLALIGKALNLPDPNVIKNTCDDGAAVCHHRILHYPPLKDYHNEISIGAHVDYGFLTILATDLVGGLQVLNAKKQRWIHVPPRKNSFVINYGSMLAHWTKNKIPATVHRVVNLTTRERYSSPFFLRPGLGTVLDPRAFDSDFVLNGNSSDDGSAKAATCEEVLAGFYQRANLLKK